MAKYFLVLLCLITLRAQSQEVDTLTITDKHREEAILANLMEQLSLTEAQIPLVASLLADRTEQIAEIRNEALTDVQKMEQIKALNLTIRLQLKEVLTAEQLDIYISVRRIINAQREKAGIVRNQIDHLVEDF